MRPLIFIWIALAACTSVNQNTFDKQDQESINQIRGGYVSGWLAGDSEQVLNLFQTDATIIPSGMAPIKGIDRIEGYWFPKDGSITTIHTYEVELLDLQGTDSMAQSLEKGTLNFTYEKGDFTMTQTSTSHAITVYKKQKDASWKIVSRMWTQLNN